MEFAFRGRPTAAAADDEENGRLRRFPDPPPSQPHGHGDANTSGVDAALLTRRQELLLELHKGFMHQDMILRELMETERAMGLTTGGYNYNPVSALPWSQDYGRRWTLSAPSLEAPLRQPCPCGCGSSTTVMAPPVYPHVERSPHAPEQTRPGNDAEQHQACRSSGVRTHPFNGYFELCHSPSKQTPVAAKAGINQIRPSSGHQQAVVWEKIGVEDVHNMQALHEMKNQSSEGQKAIDSAIEDCIKKPMHQRLQYKPADQENAANNEQKSTEFNEPIPEGTSAGVKRKLTAPSSPVKKQKPLGQWSCTVCHINAVSQHQLEEHLAGKWHRSNVAALQTSRSSNPEPSMQATPAGSRNITTNARLDGKEEVPENRWTCTLCQAKCTSESDYHSHLGGRRHRENEEARRARLYCSACDVQCNSEKMLASHLGGRRHRETLEGSESD
ncbi:unnamed protein product [Miscanthus lutarioriparius]|uniref:C2H2-type domain-containing protein n=1 Tax=Miscanthus lutarioriparius TaxID=422564 RepID=A0A811N1A5_9POAL|nr:unnamed protein product [Miscanthus lutarioriparius]